MAESQLRKAQALLKQERYDDAYVILQKVDHPTAKKWLAQIDQIQRERMQDAEDDGFEDLFDDTPASNPAATISPTTFDEKDKVVVSKNSYQAVRFISGAYRVFGYLAFGLGLLVGVIQIGSGLISDSYYAGAQVGNGLVILLSGVITGISLIAAGQLILILLELADNSRTQVRILQQIANKLS